jgi:adenosylhomocysteine nucleosidase
MERVVGLMGAMPEEVYGILALMDNIKVHCSGMRTFYSGEINDIKCVLVFSRWGKVAAATTVCSLVHMFNITDLIFIGVAGAIGPKLKIGDLIIADRLIQHDLDARPLLKQFEVPLLNMTYFQSNTLLKKLSCLAAEAVIAESVTDPFISEGAERRFNLGQPKLVYGDIASGDKFFASSSERDSLLQVLDNITCVEMEGAAVAQVCYEYDVPFSVIRLISDQADDSSPKDFTDFISEVAAAYTTRIVRELFHLL